ncbi:MAG: hypothetical protein QXJ19_00650 [Candidatus Bathyarchaeia archaeon]|nr:hypothetical protein [Candidatus Bathyarchaeota archaeon]
MLTFEHIIAKILSVRPDLSRDDVIRMIEEKEKLAGGFLTRESAALALAAEMGVAIEPKTRYEMQIKDLVSGLRDVTITGRVIYVSQLRKFIRSNGKEGIKRSIHIADKTGIAKVVLWNDMATSINPENLIDRIVRLSHLSVRRRAGGRLELNSVSRSIIEVEPMGIKSEDYPPLILFTRSVNELSQYKDKSVNVIGIIEQIYPATIFRRQNGAEGKVRHVNLVDNTGRIALVLWDNYVNALSESHIGKYAIVFGVKVKERFDGRLELHTRDKTQIIVMERKPSGFK